MKNQRKGISPSFFRAQNLTFLFQFVFLSLILSFPHAPFLFQSSQNHFLAFADEEESSQWKAPEDESKKQNPVPKTKDSIKDGKNIFEQECIKCHGARGLGDGPGASEIKKKILPYSDPLVKSQTDGQLYWKISVGRRPMPGFRKRLSPKERWSAVNYVRSLGEQDSK